MNQTHFDVIKKAQDDFITRIDALAATQSRDAGMDYVYSNSVQAERVKSRREAATFALEDGIREARAKVNTEIDTMKQAFRRYLTAPADPATLATLKALLDSGIELTDKELRAYADSQNYAILRLIAPHSHGRISAPNPDDFEKDMNAITGHFDVLAAYSGPNCELCDAVTVRPWGQSPRVNAAILSGTVPAFPGKLAEIAGRWQSVEG